MNDHTAWECPRCHKINAPHVNQCECKPENEGMTYPEIAEKYFPPIVVQPEPEPDWLKRLHEELDKIHPPSKPWDADRFPRPWQPIRRYEDYGTAVPPWWHSDYPYKVTC